MKHTPVKGKPSLGEEAPPGEKASLGEKASRSVSVPADEESVMDKMVMTIMEQLLVMNNSNQLILERLKKLERNSPKSASISKVENNDNFSQKLSADEDHSDDDSIELHGSNAMARMNELETPKPDLSKSNKKKEEKAAMTLKERLQNKSFTPTVKEIIDTKHAATSSLRQFEPFKAEKLKDPVKIWKIIDMDRKMKDHCSDYGDQVFWHQAIDSNLKVTIMRTVYPHLKPLTSNDFNRLPETDAYLGLLALAAPKSKEEYSKILQQFRPLLKFVELEPDFHSLSSELRNCAIEHCVRFEELSDVLFLCDPTLCPPTWQADKIPNGVISAKSLVGIFLDSFPHNLGEVFHTGLCLAKTGNFKEYVALFQTKLIKIAEDSIQFRSLVKGLSDSKRKKRGIVDNSSKPHRLVNINSHVQLALRNDDVDQREELNFYNITPDISTRDLGCYKMVNDGVCEYGNNCKYSHKLDHLEQARVTMIKQHESTIVKLKERKFTSSKPPQPGFKSAFSGPKPVTVGFKPSHNLREVSEMPLDGPDKVQIANDSCDSDEFDDQDDSY